MGALAVALTVTALSFGIGGAALVRRRVYLTGGLFVAAGVLLLAGAYRDAIGS